MSRATCPKPFSTNPGASDTNLMNVSLPDLMPVGGEGHGLSSQMDGWMLTYLDVFVQLTAIFVVLFLATQNEAPHEPEHTLTERMQAGPTHPTQSTVFSAPLPEIQATEPSEQIPSLPNKWQEEIAKEIRQLNPPDSVNIDLGPDMARIHLTDDILFNEARADLRPQGKQLLQTLVPMLMRAEGNIIIEGHTDDRPIRSPTFRSNWELGAARANQVLHFLIGEGISEYRLRAISYGATEPLVPNTNRENRRKNRRVSLVLKNDQP